MRPKEKNIKIQTIFLTLQGLFISSCDTLFDSKELAPYPSVHDLPMLDSIIQTLQKEPTSKIHIPRIETSNVYLPGFYDFNFDVIKKNKKYLIRWVIFDYTEQYKSLQEKQQQSHEKDIYK